MGRMTGPVGLLGDRYTSKPIDHQSWFTQLPHTQITHTPMQAPPPLPDMKDGKMDPEDARVVEADVKRTR